MGRQTKAQAARPARGEVAVRQRRCKKTLTVMSKLLFFEEEAPAAQIYLKQQPSEKFGGFCFGFGGLPFGIFNPWSIGLCSRSVLD